VKAAGALWRLVWRPAVLWLLFPLFWVTGIPLFLLWDAGYSVAAVWTGDPAPEVRSSVWLWVVLVPAVLGAGLALARVDLEGTLTAWTLPGLRRRLRFQTAGIAVTVAVLAALLAGWQGPSPLSAAAFGMAMFWFATGSAVADRAAPVRFQVVASLAFLAVAFRISGLAEHVERWPWATAALTLSACALLLGWQFSRQAARVRPFPRSARAPDDTSPWPPYGTPRYPSAFRGSDREWKVNLATDRIWPWIRAADYETSARLPSPARQLVIAAFAALFATLMNQPQLAVIVLATPLAIARLQLGPAPFHPLPRARQARVAFAGLGLEAAVLMGLLACLLLVAQAAGIPPLPWFAEDVSRVTWPAVAGFGWAWAPVAQAPMVGRRKGWENSGRPLVTAFIYMIVVLASALLMPEVGPAILLATVVGIGVVTHAVHWLFIRWHFERADLVE
jgi:hypothetical protein